MNYSTATFFKASTHYKTISECFSELMKSSIYIHTKQIRLRKSLKILSIQIMQKINCKASEFSKTSMKEKFNREIPSKLQQIRYQ